jgi:DNA repair protein RecN (Recombination protein N)
MLRQLKINNLAIIASVELELGEGLNVLTGETGAGKSILVTALELVLGGKGRADLVRTGADFGDVEACFDVAGDDEVRKRLERVGVVPERGSELRVRRVIVPSGRTRAFVNGKRVTHQVLLEVVRGLADISSQHEHHTLTDPGTHLRYLDAFAGVDELRQRVTSAYHALVRAEGAMRDFELRSRDRSTREALLRSQVHEIEDIAPEPGEDVELEQSCVRLRSMDTLLHLAAEAAELLYERDDSVVDGMARAGRSMARAAELDPVLAPLSLQLEGLRNQLEDVAREIVRYSAASRPDPAALQRAEERVHQLSRLKRRYGSTLEAVLAGLERCRAELEELEDHAATSETLAAARDRALEAAAAVARELSAERHAAADRLSTAISRELDSLGMGEARVRVELTPIGCEGAAPGRDAATSLREGAATGAAACRRAGPGPERSGRSAADEREARGPDPDGDERDGAAGEGTTSAPATGANTVIDGARLSADGLERAEFLIAPNRGEEARSLHRIASGGELSRAMLAIKCVLADLGPAGMYAFDEVDAGVGGGMAEIIGRKIRSVAQHRQVLCITHLAQIAVFADHHFKVEKAVVGERTASRVRRLSEREQREEIARMLGGVTITAKTRAVAKELLLQARKTAA